MKKQFFGAPIAMPCWGQDYIFPRPDNIFKKKESLAFEEAHSLVWRDRAINHNLEGFKEWIAHILVGILVGFIAFLMTLLEEVYEHWCLHTLSHIIENADGKRFFKPWLFYSGSAACCGLIASALTTYWRPAASGSGVAELIGYLNGVNYPGFMCIMTGITKVIGVTLAVSGKLAVGKEGPLAHIGAVCGDIVLYIPGLGFEFLRNDERKRCFIAAGASAGVSCAFGAPVGGCSIFL